MNLIKGKITKEFTLDEVNALNDLIMRDVPKAVKANELPNASDEGTTTYYRCAVCDAYLGSSNIINGGKIDAFCPNCGQRTDAENVEI